jgi:hypothetical protein
VRASFLKCGNNNERALWRIDSLQNTANAEEVVDILKHFDAAFDVSKDTKSYEYFIEAKNNIQTVVYDYNKTWTERREVSVYLFAFFLHKMYLYNAEQGVLKLKKDQGKSMYERLASGEVPECLQVSEAKNLESTYSKLMAGLMLCLAAALLYWVWRGRKKQPEVVAQQTPMATVKKTPFEAAAGHHIRDAVTAQVTPQKQPDHTSLTNEYLATLEKLTEQNTDPIVVKPPLSPKPAMPTPPPIPVAKVPQQKPVSPEVKPPIPPEIPKTDQRTKNVYLGLPQGNYFHRIHEEHIRYETFFVLTIDPIDENIGSFTFTSDDETLRYLLTMPDAMVNACQFMDKAPSSPSLLMIESPGYAKIVKGFWQIDKKITCKN